jgi:hypothetical protein
VKRSRINPVRKSLRRGEPTPAEKQAAREACFYRAEGRCELQLCAECWGYAPLDGDRGDPMTHGHLAHERSKRVHGWMESETQKHIWSCPCCHSASHNAGGKPCPPK